MRQLITTTCYQREVLQSAQTNRREKQVLLPQEDDGPPLKGDELFGILILSFVDELDGVMVAVIAKVLGV